MVWTLVQQWASAGVGHEPAEVEMTTVGVIGLGDIGSGVATSMPAAGLDLVVCDIDPEARARFADVAQEAVDPAALAAAAEVIVVAVVDDAQVLEVLDAGRGALSTAPSGATVVIVSTVSVRTIETVAAAAASRGVRVVDCGVSGGPRAAAEGELISMVGGDESTIDAIRPVLDAFSSLVVHMGPLGTGLRAKLARNVVQYGSWLAAYEGQLLAEAAGITLSKLAEVIRASDQKIGGVSTLMFRETVAPFPPDADAGLMGAMAAAAGLAHKDLRAALALADEIGVDMPLARLTDESRGRIFGVGEDGVPG